LGKEDSSRIPCEEEEEEEEECEVEGREGRGEGGEYVMVLYLLCEEEDGVDGGESVQERGGYIFTSLVNPSKQQSCCAISSPGVVPWIKGARGRWRSQGRTGEGERPSILFT
jgi:hypothetical protein